MTTKIRAYLLDTTAAIALINGDTALENLLTNQEGNLPVIALGELYYGAEKSGKRETNLQKIEVFITDRKILYPDVETARVYGKLNRALEQKGKRNQPNDVWIAALAFQHELIVLTRDEDFDNIPGLTVQSW